MDDESESEVAQSCPTLCDPVDCSPAGSSVHGILQATSVIHFLGTQGISLRVCGAENLSQGPWEPGALGAALILGGLETAGGALQLPFPSL